MKKVTVAAAIVLMSIPVVFAQKKHMNAEASKIVWIAKKVGGTHTGEIKLKNGYLEFTGNRIAGGEFVIDMNSITNTDLKDAEYNQKLLGHLKSDDFFGVAKFPTSSFVITHASSFKGNKAHVEGELTIKGITESISFEIENKGNAYLASLEIDRSKFDVRYGSKSFFNDLGDKAINDMFTLDVKLSQ